MTWIAGNRYLSITEQRNNAKIFYDNMKSKGWSDNAICAMLGNIQSESNVNPAIWENLVEYGRGFGLVQWTPYTKYSEWAGNDWETNFDKQCDRIEYEAQNGLQWFSNTNAPIIEPPISFKEFKTSTLDVKTLANYFLWYYEHPSVTIQDIRAEQAIKWYEYLVGETPIVPSIKFPNLKNKKKLPIYMYPNRHL